MSTTEIVLLDGPSPPAVTQGQFMVITPNPFADPAFVAYYPTAKPDRFFLAELDTLWDLSPVAAQRVLDAFLAIGGTHIMTGPVYAGGYAGAYPATNWLGRVDKYADFLRWLWAHSVAVTLVVMPDVLPYYDDGAKTFGRDAIERDLTPFYAELRQTGLMPARVVSQWEQWQDLLECGWLFDWMARTFPTEERCWHNPPNHLAPGPSEGPSEAECAQHAVDHGIQAWCYQADPYQSPGNPRTAFDQMQYDLWDLSRRFTMGYAGWPIGPKLYYAEGTAHPMYWHQAPQSLAQEWGSGALTVPGVVESWDGIP